MPLKRNKVDPTVPKDQVRSVLLILTDRAEGLKDVKADPKDVPVIDVTAAICRAETDVPQVTVHIVLLSGIRMHKVSPAAEDLSVTETSSRADRSPSATDAAVWAVLQALAIRTRMMMYVSLLLQSVLQSPVPMAS